MVFDIGDGNKDKAEPFDPSNGPVGDGSQHLQPESKWGHSVSLLVTAAALAVAEQLGALELSFLPAWASAVGAAAIGTLAGLLTSWAKKNR